MSQCPRGQREHDRGGVGPEHPSGHELPGVSAEEALAEREESAHQEHHGSSAETVLSDHQHIVVVNKLLNDHANKNINFTCYSLKPPLPPLCSRNLY